MNLTAFITEQYPEMCCTNDHGLYIPCGAYCPDGWEELVKLLLDLIYQTIKQNSHIYKTYPKIAQIKEKFGGLRVYMDNVEPLFCGMIDMAEAMSFRICEKTGFPGSLCVDKTGCYKTLYVEEASKLQFNVIEKKENLTDL